MSADLKVIESGDRMVFNVTSEKIPGKKYRVDLTACGGYCECSCIDWSKRRLPNITKKLPMGTRDVLCKHGIAARNYFLNQLLADMAKSETER